MSFVLAGGFLFLAFRGVNAGALWSSLQRVRLVWVIALVPLAVLSHWVRAIRWGYLLAPLKAGTSPRNLFSAVMIGYAVNNVLPRVGELYRPIVIGKLEGISRSAAFGTVVVERILDVVVFYFIASIVFVLYPNALDPLLANAESFRPVLLLVTIGTLGAFVLLFFKAEALVGMLLRFKRFLPARVERQAEQILTAFRSGFGIAREREKLAAVAGLSFLMWAIYAAGMYVPFFAFDALGSLQGNVGASVLLLVITSIAWILPAPGAMGTYHSFLTAALTQLYGVDTPTALSFSIVTHEVGYLVVMAIGGYFFFHDRVPVVSAFDHLDHVDNSSAQKGNFV